MKKTILVFGGSGLIGYNIVKGFSNAGHDVVFTFYKNAVSLKNGFNLDITQKEQTVDFIQKINPDIIINSVALAGVDLAEKNHNLADTVTVESSKNIIDGCKIIKSKLVYVSTTYVFDGKKSVFREEDTSNPQSYYGITKLRAEQLIQNSNLKYLILRTDQPYYWIKNWQRTNSVIRVLDTLRSNSILNEVIDWYNVPTYVPDFVNAAKTLLDNDENGIFHVTGSDFINRYNWSLMVAEIFHLNKKLINPITANELSISVKRDNINASNEKLYKRTGIKMKGVREGLLDMFACESVN